MDRTRRVTELAIFAFGLSGPHDDRPDHSFSFTLAGAGVLALLRGLLTAHVLSTPSEYRNDLFDAAHSAAEVLPKTLKYEDVVRVLHPARNLETAANPGRRLERTLVEKNLPVFEMSELLSFILASLTADPYSPSLDAEEFLTIAVEASEGMFSGHPSRQDFINQLDKMGESGGGPDWADLQGGPIFPYFATNLVWQFWADWYQGFVDSSPIDWELQRRVALIPNDDWAMGPEHIALKIKEIQAAYLAEKAPLAETVEINPATGNFRAVPIPVQNAPLIGTLLARVRDAVEDALQGKNGLNQTSREVRVLERTVARYGNDPQRVEMDFTSVALGLRRQINETQELPASEDNLGLLEALEDGARGLRATHPEVAANRAILAAQVWREIGAEDKARLAEALPLLEAISEGKLAEDFAADIPALINDAILPAANFAPRLPGAQVRLFNRVSKMALLLPKALNTGGGAA